MLPDPSLTAEGETPSDRLEPWARFTGVPPPADDTPIEALRHTLAVYKDDPDDRMVLMATSNIYGDRVQTGLTLGHLRALFRAVCGGSGA